MTHVRPFSLTDQAINSQKIQKYDGGILPCDGEGTGNKKGVGKKNSEPRGRKNLLINLNYFDPNRWIRIQGFVFPEAESVLPWEPALGKEFDILLHR